MTGKHNIQLNNANKSNSPELGAYYNFNNLDLQFTKNSCCNDITTTLDHFDPSIFK